MSENDEIQNAHVNQFHTHPSMLLWRILRISNCKRGATAQPNHLSTRPAAHLSTLTSGGCSIRNEDLHWWNS